MHLGKVVAGMTPVRNSWGPLHCPLQHLWLYLWWHYSTLCQWSHWPSCWCSPWPGNGNCSPWQKSKRHNPRPQQIFDRLRVAATRGSDPFLNSFIFMLLVALACCGVSAYYWHLKLGSSKCIIYSLHLFSSQPVVHHLNKPLAIWLNDLHFSDVLVRLYQALFGERK
jgi:hypothetical protein